MKGYSEERNKSTFLPRARSRTRQDLRAALVGTKRQAAEFERARRSENVISDSRESLHKSGNRKIAVDVEPDCTFRGIEHPTVCASRRSWPRTFPATHRDTARLPMGKAFSSHCRRAKSNRRKIRVVVHWFKSSRAWLSNRTSRRSRYLGPTCERVPRDVRHCRSRRLPTTRSGCDNGVSRPVSRPREPEQARKFTRATTVVDRRRDRRRSLPTDSAEHPIFSKTSRSVQQPFRLALSHDLSRGLTFARGPIRMPSKQPSKEPPGIGERYAGISPRCVGRSPHLGC